MSGDEAVQRAVMGNGQTSAAADGRRRLVELDRAEALRLLAGVEYGRIVFTQGALPAIRPVNHLIDRGRVIIRTRLTAKITTAVEVLQPTVVAYEADQLDPVERLGWSVVVTGLAHPVIDETEAHRLQAALVPWVTMTMDTILAIEPTIITGYRLTTT